MLPLGFEGREQLYYELQGSLDGKLVAHLFSQSIRKSNLPSRGIDPIQMSPEERDLEAFIKLKAYQEDISNQVKLGKGVYITGPVGNGKSSWAYKIAQQYIWNTSLQGDINVFPVYFISVPTLMAKIKEGFDDSQLRKELTYSLNHADLVIFDDIGAENKTNYSQEQMFLFINERYAQGKATIFTSNLQPNQLETRIGDRIREMTETVTITGASSR